MIFILIVYSLIVPISIIVLMAVIVFSILVFLLLRKRSKGTPQCRYYHKYDLSVLIRLFVIIMYGTAKTREVH